MFIFYLSKNEAEHVRVWSGLWDVLNCMAAVILLSEYKRFGKFVPSGRASARANFPANDPRDRPTLLDRSQRGCSANEDCTSRDALCSRVSVVRTCSLNFNLSS